MSESFPFPGVLPAAAEPAVQIVRKLADAGHVALLNGGCVRDLLRGDEPKDYDVATDAPPDRVCGLFPKTRKVGVQFGVVLVKKGRSWVEVATFRVDGPYLDGRRPSEVHFGDARLDAQRRDFTINGMFLDPLASPATVIDYVSGRADLETRFVRAIGDPAARFAEDHLRLLRAVRFAARLNFEIEPATLAAVRADAAKLRRVAPERVREELEKMLASPTRRRALQLLNETGLLPHLWAGATWRPEQIAAAESYLERLPLALSSEPAFAALVADRPPREIDDLCRKLTFSNEQRETVLWLARHQADLDDPAAPSLADLKRLMAHPAFNLLRALAEARYQALLDDAARLRRAALEKRLAAIDPTRIQPPPFVGGDDLAARGVPPGPLYKKILDELYTRQLNEEFNSREEALQAMEDLLRRH